MSCETFNVGGATVIGCGRNARALRCATCNKLGQLCCDGCDAPLCAACSVSPRTGLDFCPTCCKPYFKEWCATEEGQRYATGHRELRRGAFRAWAKNFACLRLESIRSPASREVEAANNGTLNAPVRRKRR